MPGEVIARLFVAGRPRTKGSLKPIHIRGGKGRPCRVSLTEDHEKSDPWKRTMIKAIRVFMADGHFMHSGPVEVHAFYRFERELETGAKRRSDRSVWPSHDTDWPTAMDIGDEDKLRRNLLDALTQSGLLADDRLVVGGVNLKRWCLPDELPGVAFVVCAASDPELLAARERKILGE